MTKQISLFTLLAMALIIFVPNLQAQQIFQKDGDFILEYKNKSYVVQQYEQGNSFKVYSLQYHSPDEDRLPDALMLIIDEKGKVIKELVSGPEYAPHFIFYDINDDHFQDLIVFWQQGAHSETVEVWMNQGDEDFKKVFEEFNDKNIIFTVRNGVPTLAFKEEYPMSLLHDNFPDKDWVFKKWNGKTFK